jgi:hypothetical protein
MTDPPANNRYSGPEWRIVWLLPASPECRQSRTVGDSHFCNIVQFPVVHAGAQVPILADEDGGDDQGLSDSPIAARRCISSSIKPTSACFARGSLLAGLANRLVLSHIYTVVHSVGPSVVIALHCKDVPILGEELFQLSDSALLRFCLAAAATSL